MRGYGKRKRSSAKIHGHECGICGSHDVPLRGTARMKLKQELRNMIKNLDSS
jgi:hypothetical protein